MSSGKRFIGKKQIVTAGDMSGNVTSTIMNIQGIDNVGIQVNLLSGTPTGTFDIKVSADHTQDASGAALVAGNFVSIGTNYQVTMTSGSPSNIYFDLTQLSAPYVELVYTRSSGTGTFDAFLTGKAI